ncbi:MAG: gliding motility-associated C-terminal domain-containing protein [Bacteroidetes bacterium]|nr:gliding motility-associated C-terminal domain-containing protein [Bacteroidota bacterium]
MFFCCFQQAAAQCSIFAFPSTFYDCLTGQSTVVYTVSGAQAPYTCTLVNQVNNATVTTGNIATPIGGGLFTGTTTGVSVGNFNVFITAANNCTLMTTLQVIIPFSSANLLFTPSMVSCFGGNDGSALASINGPFVAPFTYTWAPTGPPTQTSQTAVNLTAGIYSATVKDSKGCVVTNTVMITEPPLITSVLSKTLIPCFGASINSAITTTGGTSPFTYTVNGIAVAASTASALTVGTYTILTKDSKGCLISNTVQLSQVSQPVITFSYTPPLCPGSGNGAASATVSNAPPSYSYTWQPVISFTNNVNNIVAGNYTLTVKDASACVTKSVVAVVPAVNINASVTTKPENCSALDGTATLSISGGNFPYSYTTIPVGPHSSNILTNLSSGSYTTIIKDANSCLDTIVYVVANLSTVSVSVSSFTPVLCYSQCTGVIVLSVQNAAAPVTYSASGSPTTSSNMISGMCAGYHIIKVTDAIGCPATTTINFPSPAVFSYSASAPTAICYGTNINMQATASGGAPGSYNYVWNPGNISGQLISTSPPATTSYSLNVYDSNNCTLAPYVFTITVAPPLAININASATGICPGTTAQITPTITGGDGNYTYNWLPGNSSTSFIYVQNVEVPSYTLYVNDGCGSPTAVRVVTINLFPVTAPTYTVLSKNGCEPLCTQFINTTPKSTNAIWNYGDKPFEQVGNTTSYCYEKAGDYNVKITVTDSNSCKMAYTYSNAIHVMKSPTAAFITEPEVITLNNSENVLIKNITANGNQYAWSVNNVFFSASENIIHSFSDTGCVVFKLVARNQNNCYDSLEKQICVLEGFNFWMPDCFTPNTDNLNDILIPKGTAWIEAGYQFEVYNRWGKRIFHTSDPYKGWDGKAGDDTFDPSNVYFWRATVTDNIHETHEMKGHVLLLR